MRVLEADLAPGQWEAAIPHLPLVRMCANRYPSHVFDDAVADGTLGLLRAIQRFDPRRGTKFSTFAVPAIHSAIIAGRRNARREAWRDQQRTGGEYEAPGSLDLIEYRTAAPDSVEDDATYSIVRAEAEQLLRSVCKDDLDHRLVDGLLSPNSYATSPLPAGSPLRGSSTASNGCSAWPGSTSGLTIRPTLDARVYHPDMTSESIAPPAAPPHQVHTLDDMNEQRPELHPDDREFLAELIEAVAS